MTADAKWRRALVTIGLTIAAILMLFHADVGDMAGLWWSVSTYQHCLFVLPIIGWLLWQRRHEVAQVEPAGWPPGVVLVLASGIVWLLGQAAGVALIRHAGLVLVVQASVVAVLGPAVARAAAFPLFYLVFLVPFGDEFVAPMQTLTARMTMALLGMTGVAAHLDGVFITTRAGWFEVAEACAGVKFLIAMVAYGALVAQVCFRSKGRRALFMAAAVVLPVLANGVRAWGTIYVASFTSAAAASGFDHIVYGWVFFGLVMALLVASAWPFFDRSAGAPWLRGRFEVWRPRAAVVAMAPLAVLTAMVPVAWDRLVTPGGRIALPAEIALPAVAGWARVAIPAAPPWVPRFDGADHRLLGTYADPAGDRVDVAVALYGWQGKGREIVGFGQGAADPQGPWKWAADLPSDGAARAERLLARGGGVREAVTFRQVGGVVTRSKAETKLAAMTARLVGGDQSAAVLIVSAQGPRAHAVIARFVRELSNPQAILRTLLATARGRR